MAPERLAEILRSLSLFARLDPTTIQYLIQHTTLELFGIGEHIATTRAFDQAFYVLLSGQVLLSVKEQMGQKHEITHLSEGEFLGGMVFSSGEPSRVDAIVTQTTNVLKISPKAIAHLTQHHPKFAVEMSQFIEEREKLIRLVEGVEHFSKYF